MKRLLIGGGLALLLVIGGVLIGRMTSTGIEPTVQRTVVSTIQREAGASFYVTGMLDVTATEQVSRTETAFPVLMQLLRTAQPSWPLMGQRTVDVTVRVPGRISYGFEVSDLQPDDIRVANDGRVEVTLPPLRVHAVAPDLSRLRIKTETSGWMWVDADQVEATEREALTGVQNALRRQGEEHLQQATQPRVNTARALEEALRPALQAAGVSQPRFRFYLGADLVLEPSVDG